jgi:tetratricopeptide (TPR) repeat protein/transglutaminase-like putative cysteine protease
MFRSLRCALLLVSLPAAAARLDSPTTELAERHAAAALELSRSPRAAAHLYRLHELRDEVDDLNLLAQTYSTLLRKGGVDPLVKGLALQLYSDVERTRGRLAKAQAMLEPLGFISQFYVVGSFENEGKSGCNTDFGPEAAVAGDARFPISGREVSFRPLNQSSRAGYVDLSAVLRPNSEAVAYALAFLEAPAETRTQLSVGASGAFRLFVNGSLAASEDRYNLPRPEQSRVTVRLRKGINRVLLKVCQENGPLGFYLRQTRSPGGGASAKVVLPEAPPPLPKGVSPQPVPLPSLTEAMAREVVRAPADPQLRAEYATVLHFQRAFDERQRSDIVEAEKAVELKPQDVSLRLLAAELRSDDANERRKHLESAIKLEPSNPHVILALAEIELAADHPERALEPLEKLATEQPRYGAARLALASAYQSLGEWPRAIALVEAALRDLPHLPEVVREGVRVSRRLDRPQEAAARTRTALGLRYDDIGSRRALAFLLADLARIEEAVQQLELVLQLDPFDNHSRLRLAELQAANGQLAEAQVAFAAARQLSPDEPEVHEREGRALLATGKREEALASFRRSLALRPQNPALKEVMRSLEGEDPSFGTQHLVDVRPLLKQADAFAGEDAVYLVDSTYVRVQPSGLASRLQQLAVKVNSARAVEAFRSYPIGYSPDRQEVRVLMARVTKPDGSVVDSHGEADRHMNEPWTGMYYDARSRILSFPALSVGDVLELRFRIDDTAQDNLLSDYWGEVDYVQGTSAKLRYQFLADMPAKRKLYWNKSSLPQGVSATVEPEVAGRQLYRFTAQNVSRIIPEPMMPGYSEVATTLHVSTYQTWEAVGRYYWGLVRDQLTPNDELKKTVEKVLTGVDRKDQLAVVNAIYSFVVSNTRYVALEFGIHGFKPYRVDRVLARRFGDCKDKASLIHAMLKIAGVDSRLVLLRMRNLGSIGPEPASLAAFNHAIAYVPQFQLFLDGTAEFHAARELPGMDRTADVLIIEPDGKSPFTSIPESKADDNLTSLELDVAVRADGSATLKGGSTIIGQQAPEYRRSYQASASRKQIFEQGWAQTFPGLTVKEMTISDPTQLGLDVKLGFEMGVPRYAEVLPRGLRFFPLGGGRNYTQVFAPLSERKLDLAMGSPWANRFTYRYQLPQGMRPGELPPEVKEETPFGRFGLRCKAEEAKLTCEGEVAFTVSRVKAADYASFRAFLGRIDQTFSRKLVAFTAEGQTATRP